MAANLINLQQIIHGVINRDTRSIARALSLCENKTDAGAGIIRSLFKRGGSAHVVGITGSPGAGKSTLVDQLALNWHKAGKKVAVLAVDPSSPFTGGAILGDRIRMQRTAEFQEIFVRSMASRGMLGGLSRATADAVAILDAASFDIIIIETVGVGQGEIDIVRTAHTCLVVLVPGMGDEVQAIKAGILEIADIFVINKSDREGADALERDIFTLLGLAEEKYANWKIPIVRTVATEGAGAAALCAQVESHANWTRSAPEAAERRFIMMRETIVQLAGELVRNDIIDRRNKRLQSLTEQCLNREMPPTSAAKKLLSGGIRTA